MTPADAFMGQEDSKQQQTWKCAPWKQKCCSPRAGSGGEVRPGRSGEDDSANENTLYWFFWTQYQAPEKEDTRRY